MNDRLLNRPPKVKLPRPSPGDHRFWIALAVVELGCILFWLYV